MDHLLRNVSDLRVCHGSHKALHLFNFKELDLGKGKFHFS